LNFRHGFLLILAMVMLALASGCESPEARVIAMDEKVDDSFAATVELCRKVSKKSGKRIGISNEFRMTSKSNVRAFLDVENVELERTYTWHLSWVKPDGKEMFRKFAEVKTIAVPDGFETTIQWKKAHELLYLKETVISSEEPAYSLATKLNISESKERIPGAYKFQVYLDRKYLLEEEFTVLVK